MESLICSYAFWSCIPDTAGGVSHPYYLKASCLYFQFSALIPICFHDIKKEKDCDLLKWHIQVTASKSLLSPNTVMAPDVMKIFIRSFSLSSYMLPILQCASQNNFTCFSGAIEESYQDLEIDLILVQDLGTFQSPACLLNLPIYKVYMLNMYKQCWIQVLQWKQKISGRFLKILTIAFLLLNICDHDWSQNWSRDKILALDKVLPSLILSIRKMYLSLMHNKTS